MTHQLTSIGLDLRCGWSQFNVRISNKILEIRKIDYRRVFHQPKSWNQPFPKKSTP